MPRRRRGRTAPTAISPRLATSTVSNIAGSALPVLLHAEDAVTRLGQGHVGARGEGEAEDRARLQRVDHAVVPEPCGGVVGVALRLVLAADRGPELRLLLG